MIWAPVAREATALIAAVMTSEYAPRLVLVEGGY